jgi:hypothetical protein
MRIAIAVVLLAACGEHDISRELGARCDRASDCAERCLTPSGDYPNGLCTVDCSDNGDCPSDGVCVEREGGVCLFECQTPSDCEFLGAGWNCKEENLQSDPQRKVLVCRGG